MLKAEKKKITQFYLNKIKELTKYNKYYFDENLSIIDDKKYDELKKEILSLEKKYLFLNNKNSPSKSIGFRPSKNFVKAKHRVRMLSLSNSFDKKDLENFEKKYLIFYI